MNNPKQNKRWRDEKTKLTERTKKNKQTKAWVSSLHFILQHSTWHTYDAKKKWLIQKTLKHKRRKKRGVPQSFEPLLRESWMTRVVSRVLHSNTECRKSNSSARGRLKCRPERTRQPKIGAQDPGKVCPWHCFVRRIKRVVTLDDLSRRGGSAILLLLETPINVTKKEVRWRKVLNSTADCFRLYWSSINDHVR